MPREHLPGWTIFWTIKQVSVNFKGLKSHKEHPRIKTELNQKLLIERYLKKRKIPKYFEINQHSSTQLKDERRNHKRNQKYVEPE